jgi:hypothetical protein
MPAPGRARLHRCAAAQSRHFGNEALSLHRQQLAQLCARVILPLAPGTSQWLPS